MAGLVNRGQLEGISGRGRKRQIELAKEFGLEDYPTPASGCLLTDAGYSNRLRDLLQHTERLTFDDLNLLKYGRHFRLDSQTKVIVGRNEQDNNAIMQYRKDYHAVLEAPEIGSPITLLIGPVTEENIEKAAMITARYSSAKFEASVPVACSGTGIEMIMNVSPARDEDLAPVAIR